MTTTVKFRFPLDTVPDLRADMMLPNSPSVVNGSGSACTITTKGCGSFTFDQTLSTSVLYDVIFYKVSDGTVFSEVGTVWIEANGGTFNLNDDEAFARFMQKKAKNLEIPRKPIDDTTAQDFIWEVSNSGGVTMTSKRKFSGQAAYVNCSATPVFVATVGGKNWWKFPYALVDRAEDGTTVKAGVVQYEFTDSRGVKEDFAIEFYSISSGAGNGSGNISWEIVVKDTNNSPIKGCTCWVATDVLGNNVITAEAETNSRGEVSFLLDPGTYYLFRQKNGVTFTNPIQFTVS